MSKTLSTPPAARSWRDIPQHVAPRTTTKVGRRRVTFNTVKTVATIVVGLALAGGAFEVWRTWQANPSAIAGGPQSEPVREITLRTDGVLDQAWVEATLALPEGVGMMELDLFALRDRLTASGQVASAVVAREFPATLMVALEERSPVLRLRAPLDDGRLRDFLLARDGTIFMGEGFAAELLDRLPWLAGVKLAREGAGFAPLTHLGQVADLLATASSQAPALYRDWRTVSLARFDTDGHIVVQSGAVPEIVFGTREDFLSQVARLDLILERMRGGESAVVRSINLAVGAAQVPVAFDLITSSVSSFPSRSPRAHPKS
jgi:cell division protein FtsQ